MPESSQQLDSELWARADRDPEAFGEIFARHARSVFAFCARRTADLAVADDLTSVVFLEAWRRRRTIRLEGTSALPLLLGVANNVVRNHQRALRRHRAALARMAEASSPNAAAAAAFDRIEIEQSIATAAKAIEGLPADQRDVVYLVLWSELSYEEAAIALAVPVGTVRSRLARARRQLQGVLRTQVLSPI